MQKKLVSAKEIQVDDWLELAGTRFLHAFSVFLSHKLHGL